jgi:hypothetical protein
MSRSPIAPASATTIRERRDEWIRAGAFARLRQIALEACDRIVGFCWTWQLTSASPGLSAAGTASLLAVSPSPARGQANGPVVDLEQILDNIKRYMIYSIYRAGVFSAGAAGVGVHRTGMARTARAG